MGAIQFIENLDRTSLTISDADFEKHVEAAVSLIAEKHTEDEAKPPLPSRHTTNANHLPISEKSAPSRAEVTPRNSLEAERSTPRRGGPLRNGSKTDSEDGEEIAAVTGLLKTIQRPLSTIGRIFSDDNSNTMPPSEKVSAQISGLQPPLTPQPARKLSPTSSAGDSSSQPRRSAEQARQQQQEQKELRQRLSAEDAAARQASAEAEEARRLRVREEANVVETLCGMFPGLDRDVIMDVVRANEGR